MTLRLFDSMTDRKVAFVPLEPGKVRLYVCGPTVYDMSHIGHARCYVAWDVVVRHLKRRGYDVTYVRNFTDVDDKIIRRAAERGMDPLELSRLYADEYLRDMAALGNKDPDVQPRVSDNIPQIIALIEKLIARGHAYASKGDVYFAIRSFESYGKLSKRKLDDLLSGARVEPGEQKRDPLDFALWKAAKPGEIKWLSPWGEGRPGWHIECSAMSERYLGETFDIHAGGKDLVFPHHENEIAQSEAASGKTFANYWMHNGFVVIDDEKMSKSLGNVQNIRTLCEAYQPQAVRLFLLGTHYRAPINFSESALQDAEKRVEYIYETLAKADARLAQAPVEPEGEVIDDERLTKLVAGAEEILDDDFNTAEVLGLWSPSLTWLNELCDKAPAGVNKVVARRTLMKLRQAVGTVASMLGVGEEEPRAFLDQCRQCSARKKGIDPGAVDALIRERLEARQAKDFAKADAIRARATELGVEIMDTPAGTTWRVL
jgi:cysteinyl-tRNA synthetase